MRPAENYRIYQRKNGGAKVLFSGDVRGGGAVHAAYIEKYAAGVPAVEVVALREEDGAPVIPWTAASVGPDGTFSAELFLPEGGPYTLDARIVPTPDTDRNMCERVGLVYHVGVGEVFLLAGQSNMSGYGRDMALDPPEPGVHLFANDGRWRLACHPINDSLGSVYPENLEPNSGTCPALAFGRTLRRLLGVPVGLIAAALGGSALDRWDPDGEGRLTAAMLRRIPECGEAGGIIWYQGCSDTAPGAAESYFDRFARTVAFWREKLGPLPVYTVQLNRMAGSGFSPDTDRGWGLVRQAQLRAARDIDDVFIVSAADMPMSDGIHNSSVGNVALGERLADAAAFRISGRRRGHRPFSPARAAMTGEKTLRLEFPPDTLFVLAPAGGDGFDAEDADGLIPCRRALTRRNALELELERPPRGEARLHGFWRAAPPPCIPRDNCNNPMLSFFGLPVAGQGKETSI